MSVDLSTRYLGLSLKNPLVASASPLTGDVASLRRLERSGVAAAVLPSLFEEQIEHEELEIFRLHEFQTESYAESLDFFPDLEGYNTGPDSYLTLIREAKRAVDIPIIGSLNGSTAGGWTHYAHLIEEAGADALELNIYFVPVDPAMTGQEVEEQYLTLIREVRRAVSIPLAVKIGPFFSSLPHMAHRMIEAGADGLVLFNRYLEPDIDLETLDVVPNLVLSRPQEVRLPLRWIAILRDQVEASLAATSGIHETSEVIKVLLAGADVAMMASALLQRGPKHVSETLEQLRHWLTENEYESVSQLKGSVSRENCAEPSAYERSNYMKALISYTPRYT